MSNYKFLIVHHPDGSSDQTSMIKRTDTTPNLFIPFYPDNTDYQEYLAWVADGNTAEAAD